MDDWRRYRRRRYGVPSAIAIAIAVLAAGAVAWFQFGSVQPKSSSSGVMLALAPVDVGPAKAAPTTTVALLGLDIRRRPPQVPDPEPLALEPPTFESTPGTGPGLISLAPSLPGPEPSAERADVTIEADEPDGGTDVASGSLVTLVEPGASVPPEAAPVTGLATGAPEPTVSLDIAAVEGERLGGVTLAVPHDVFAVPEPEPSSGPDIEFTPVPGPPEPTPVLAPEVALAYPTPPDPGAAPTLEPDIPAPPAPADTRPEPYEPQVALAEPVSIDVAGPKQTESAPIPAPPEMPAAAELDLPAADEPKTSLASDLAPWKAPAPQLESGPDVAALALPALENGSGAAVMPAVHLFELSVVPGFDIQRSDASAPGRIEVETSMTAPTHDSPVATLAVTAAAPSPETELPVEFAAILPTAGLSLSTFVLSAALALEAQPDETPASDEGADPDEMIIDVAAALTAGRTDAKRAVDWLAYARPFVPPADKPLVAVVLLGLGPGRAATDAALKLPSVVTLGFSSYVRDLQDWIDLARAAGHEVMLDLPMEPMKYPDIDPGPQALMTSLPDAENLDRLKWHLDRATGYFGVTNNMGSRFTSSPDALEPVLSTLKLRGLMYLDSRTSRSHVAETLASEIGLPRAINDRFLDDQASRAAIDAQLAEIERIARRTGFAVAVGHAFPVTIDRLSSWLPTLEDKGIALAPLSAIVGKQAPR